MFANIVGGAQGIVDHILVGNFVGSQANAAIGASWQIFLVVIVFISSLFTGMSVLVARFVGAGDAEKVDRVVYQAFLTAIGLSLGVMAPIGYFISPWLLDLVNAAPAVQAEALPFLRIMFVFSSGMLVFFMLGGALRSAGDARTPMKLGIAMTGLNLVLNVILIRGLGPIPAFGTRGSAMGTCIRAEFSPCIRSGDCGPAAGSYGFRVGRVLPPIGRSSNRCSASACRRASRASR
jgi:Na+-driven multidrug efflux pump